MTSDAASIVLAVTLGVILGVPLPLVIWYVGLLIGAGTAVVWEQVEKLWQKA